MDYALGVDLGTTYTAAAVHVDGRAQIVRLGSRRAEIPSLVFVREDGVVLVGDAAERRGAEEPVRLAREFKRRLGDPVPVLVGGAPYSAHALMARVLEHVYQTVVRQQEGPPSVVCVTHPANWGPYKRELLMQAVQIAEVPNVGLRPEPEAAAVRYAAQERVRPGEIVAVYDLGGGTFDTAVLRKTETDFEVLGQPVGVEQLGGVDFDEAVVAHVMAVLGPHADALDPQERAVREALVKVRRDCVEAKEALSEDTEAVIPVALPKLHTRIRITRAEFEEMIRPALADTVGAMRRALRSAEVRPEQLRAILLSGGSSRIPLVSQLLSTTFERPVVLDPHPEHGIALGAAEICRGRAPAARVVPAQRVAAQPVNRVPGPDTSAPRSSPPAQISSPPAVAATGRVKASAVASPPPLPPPPPTPPSGKRRSWRVPAVLAAVAVLVIAAGAAFLIQRRDPGAEPTAGPPPPATTTASAASTAPVCGFIDDFGRPSVNALWERTRPDAKLKVADGTVTLDAPEGSDLYDGHYQAPMLLRRWTGDFVLETELTAEPDRFYQGAGLVLWNGPRGYVRVERAFGDVGAVIFEYRDGGKHIEVRSPWRADADTVRTDVKRVVLQLERKGTTVSARWRPSDRTDFEELGAIDVGLPETVKAGVAVLNRAQRGADPAPFSAGFERVSLTC
ncbi:Hsp70 family protein [Actinoplanes sp. NPDC051346]|uniref:Hsp70 family protein n=1 Tax=Actinoplanes sp. NPDC051346 TaxID=3155048 RepID=UPI0034326866